MILKKELNMNKQIFKTFHIRTKIKQFLHNKGIRIKKPKHQKFLNKNFYLYGRIKADYDTGWSIELSRDAKIIFDIGCNPRPIPCSVENIGTVRPLIPCTVYCSPMP